MKLQGNRFTVKMNITTILLKSAVVFILLWILWGCAFTGQKTRTGNKDTLSSETAVKPADILIFPIKLYRNTLSRVDGNRFRMEPSCSTFCIDALTQHGFLLGWIMCSDRLVRCGRDEEKISASIRINDEMRIYDPVSNNDFWW